MLSLKRDLKYIGLVDIFGKGNWAKRANVETVKDKKIWSINVYVPWDNEKRYYYCFEIDGTNLAHPCRYYSTDENGDISAGSIVRYVKTDYNKPTRNNLFLFANDVLKSKWNTEEARAYRGY